MFDFSFFSSLGMQSQDSDSVEQFAVYRALNKAKRIKEKIEEIEKIKTPWVKRQKQNYLRLKNEPILAIANFVLSYCSKASIKANEEVLKIYLVESFPEWATPFDAVVFFEEALNPRLDNYDRTNLITFSATGKNQENTPDLRKLEKRIKDEFYKDRPKVPNTLIKKTIPPYSIDIHLTVAAPKEYVLKFIDENWSMIKYGFLFPTPESRLKKEFAKKIVIRSLLSTLKPNKINELSQKQLLALDITYEEIYDESAKFQKQKKDDAFKVALEELASAVRGSQSLVTDMLKLAISNLIPPTTEQNFTELEEKLNEFRRFDLIFDKKTGLFHIK